MSTALGLPICSAPGSFAIHRDAAYTKHLLTTAPTAYTEVPKVVLATEAKDYDAKRVVAGFDRDLREEWTAYQVTRTEATQGIAAFVHKSVHVLDWGITLGARPYIAGRRIKMLVRYPMWLHVRYHGQSYFLVGCHSPKVVFKPLQKPYLEHVHTLIAGHPNAVVAGDWNNDYQKVKHQLGLYWAYGDGIIGIMGRKHTQQGHRVVSKWGIQHKMADHPAIYTTVRPR